MSVMLKLLATVRCCALPSQGDDDGKRCVEAVWELGAVVAARVVVHSTASTVVEFQLVDSQPNTRASTGWLLFRVWHPSLLPSLSACHNRLLCELEL